MSKAIGNDIEFMENITFVMTKTANSFNDIMKMPIVTLFSIIKNIRIEELMQNQEWREKYLKLKIQENYKSGKIQRNTKCDLNGLEAFTKNLT